MRASKVLVVLALVVGLAGCVPDYVGAPGGSRVAVVSDSVLWMAEDAITADLRRDHRVSFVSQNALRAADAYGLADQVVATDPDTVVLSFGTNDMFGGLGAAATAQHLANLRARFARSCVVMVTLNANVPDGSIATRSGEVNRSIRQWTQVADWDRWVTEYYRSGQPAGALFYDLIHVTPAGKAPLASVVGTAARRCRNRGAPFGHLDAVGAPDAGTIRLRGWTIDPDTTRSLDVHVWVDDRPVAAGRADRPRPDVGAQFPGYGPAHGFDLTVPGVPAGARRVCVYGINVAQGSNGLVGCATTRVP